MTTNTPCGSGSTPVLAPMTLRHNTPDELQTFRDDFQRDLQVLRQLIVFKPDLTNSSDLRLLDKMEPSLSSMAAQLSRVESAIRRYRSHIRAETAQLGHLSEMQRRVTLQAQRVAVIKKNMPPEIARMLEGFSITSSAPSLLTSKSPSANHVAQTPAQASAAGTGSEDDPTEAPFAASPVASKPPVSQGKKAAAPSAGLSARPPPLQKGRGTRQRTGDTPSSSAGVKESSAKGTPKGGAVNVRSATEQELAAAPQYVKGRLTIESLDKIARKLTDIAVSKYELLRKPNSALSSTELSQCQAFREAFCDDTNGKKFITEAEIKGFGEYRIDSTVKNGINVLRHIGSLKEVRGKNRTRIFIINGSD